MVLHNPGTDNGFTLSKHPVGDIPLSDSLGQRQDEIPIDLKPLAAIIPPLLSNTSDVPPKPVRDFILLLLELLVIIGLELCPHPPPLLLLNNLLRLPPPYDEFLHFMLFLPVELTIRRQGLQRPLGILLLHHQLLQQFLLLALLEFFRIWNSETTPLL